ncbi:MAG: cytochrome P450, partial [Actinomycetia bacterium]|nr:cytochrome P450 [Actinomycetes bacterium]
AMDPPEHTRLRRLVARSFTNLRVKALRPRVQALVDDMLDEMAAVGPPFDVVPGIAQQLPIAVICELLGVPTRDGPYFRELAQVILSLTASTPAQVGAARGRFSGYLARLAAEKRADPDDDLISDLVRAGDEHEALSMDETISMARTLLLAGAHTTANEIALSCLVLLRRRERYALLLERPELLRPAVEELLRYNSLSNSGGFLRIAREDVELGGVTIRAGEAVLPSIVSANRDATTFADADEIVLDRPRNAHLAFGHGLHHCLGAHLARAELEIAIGSLLRRFPTLHLSEPDGQSDAVGVDAGQLLRGIPRLLVAW